VVRVRQCGNPSFQPCAEVGVTALRVQTIHTCLCKVCVQNASSEVLKLLQPILLVTIWLHGEVSITPYVRSAYVFVPTAEVRLWWLVDCKLRAWVHRHVLPTCHATHSVGAGNRHGGTTPRPGHGLGEQ